MKKSVKNKKVLVTGAAGFIGSHLTEMLLKGGARVTALVRYTSSGQIGWLEYLPPSAKDRLSIIHGDIRDPDICEAAVKGNDYIFNLAAQIAIPYSYIAPRDFLAVNAVGTANMLQAARAEEVKKILQVSTSEVYGTAQYAPIDERHPQVAQSPYSASKIAADKTAQSFYHSFGLPVVTVRPFNCYGPRQSARAIIPTIILQALRGRVIRLGNVESSRDLNFVTDIAAGMIDACLNENTSGMTMNLASGEDHPIAELVDIIGGIINKRLSIKTEKRRKRPASSEVWRLVGDSTLAKETIGYKSTVTMQAGLKKTIEFFEKHIDMYAKEDYQL
ncbi:MAG: NAD-dependent dehydratase [candidate division Zixibacteria bacterium HGW-Zixibacteria-1]|nr:MAG: NAD-dependent dehydratase [candidate division Zixibacteria bacterium HGW-Zixibacteria-1]